MKKLVALVLTLALVLPMFGSVGALADTINKEGYPISDEPITITVSGSASNWGEKWNDTVMVAEIEKRLGIKLVCDERDEWDTQFTLMLASDELPDMILCTNQTASQIADYGSQGYFLPLESLIDEYAPNLRATMERFPQLRDYMTSPDGHIYTLYGATDNIIEQVPRFFLNQVWLDKLGMAHPETLDEFYAMLKAFKEKDPNGNGEADEIPLAFGVSTFTDNVILSAFGFRSRENKYILQEKDGQVYLGETSENYKDYLKFMHKLFAEGLLDPNSFSGESADAEKVHNQNVIDDKVGAFAAWAPFVTTSRDISEDKIFGYLGALSSQYSPEPTLVLSRQIADKGMVLVNAQTEHPEAIMRLLDYFYTDEGSQAAMRGWEGVTFDYESLPYAGLENYPIATMRAMEGYASPEEFRYKKAVINTGFMFLTTNRGTQYAAIEAATPEQLEEMLPAYGWAVLIARDALKNPKIKYATDFPVLIYNEQESGPRNTYYTDISLYLENMRAQFITGEVDVDAGWETYQNTLNQMGLQEALKIEQAAYDRLFK